jgi:hypothetical protein
VVNLKRVKIKVEGKINRRSDGLSVPGKHDFRTQVRHGEKKIHKRNKSTGTIKRYFRKQMSTDKTLRIHNTISKATLYNGRDLWLMNRREQIQLEAAQMRFLRPLVFRISKELLTLG